MKTLQILLGLLLICCVLTAPVYRPNDPNKKDTEFCLKGDNDDNYGDCIHCRSEKSNFGKNVDETTKTDQSHGLRKDTAGKWKCQEKANSEMTEKFEACDQEMRVEHCEIYDSDGLCVECHCDFGLYWEGTTADDGSSDGKWTCIENEFRTRNCHKYNSNKDCMQCKWNKGNTEMSKFYAKAEFSHDYGLVVEGDNIYCIDNQARDFRIQQIFKDYDTTQNYQQANCAEYRVKSDKKQLQCKKCHSRMFNLNGDNRWASGQADFSEISYDYWIENTQEKSTGANYDAHTCKEYPRKYITTPEQLKKFAHATGNVIASTTATECVEGQKLKEDALKTGTYGCVAEVKDCNSYHFKWDLERYKLDRKWFKTFWKCNGCVAGKKLTVDGSGCVADTNLGNCTKATDADNCAECAATYYLTTDNNKKICKKQDDAFFDQTVAPNLANCKAGQHDTVISNNKKYLVCKECKFGYVGYKTANGVHECKKWNDLTNVKSDFYTGEADFLNKPGCQVVKAADKKCENSTARYGFDGSGACSTSLVSHIRQLCPVTSVSSGVTAIDNCSMYSLGYGSARCMKCTDNHVLDSSRTQCLAESEAGVTVTNCDIQDGTWCRRCKATFILTNENTCVKMPTAWATKNCQIAMYTTAKDYTKKLQKCHECYEGYKANTTDCTQGTCCDKEDLYSLETTFKTVEKTTGIMKCETAGLTAQYVLDDATKMYKPICRKAITNCRYYRKNQERCYECQNGFTVKSDGTCESCTNGKTGKNVYGERVCVDAMVTNCELYTQKGDQCLACKEGKFLEIDSGNTKKLKCSDTCGAETVSLGYAKVQACIATADANAHADKVYEFYVKTDGNLNYRTTKCNNNYVTAATDPDTVYYTSKAADYKCTKYQTKNFRVTAADAIYYDGTANNVDKQHTYTRIWGSEGGQTEPEADLGDDNMLQTACAQHLATDGASLTVMDKTHKKCVLRADAGGAPVANCFAHTLSEDPTAKNCIRCFPGFMLETDASGNTTCQQLGSYPFFRKAGGITAVTNCVYTLNKTTDAGKVFCKRCENGYIWARAAAADECKQAPHPACAKVKQSDGTCEFCESPYRLIANKSDITACQLTIPQCKRYKADGTCDHCYFGYKLDDGKCKKLSPNCTDMEWDKSYDKDNKFQIDYCKTCFSTDTDTNGTVRKAVQGEQNNRPGQYCHLGCEKKNRMMGKRTGLNKYNNWTCCNCDKTQFYKTEATCFRGLILDPVTKCAQFDQQSGKCDMCVHDNAGKKRQLGPDSTGKYCLDECNIITGCKTVDLTQKVANNADCKCTECTAKNEYIDSTGKCKAITDGQCLEGTGEGACTKCSNYVTHYLDGGACKARTNNTCKNILAAFDTTTQTNEQVKNYDTTKDECIKCFLGHKLDPTDKQCKTQTDNCFEWDSAGKCQLCDFTNDVQTGGFGLNKTNGECIKNETKNVKCKTYTVNGTTKTCVECYTNDIIDKAGFTNKVATSVFDSGSDPDSNEVCKRDTTNGTSYCLFGFTELNGNTRTVPYCKLCMEFTNDGKNIFYTKNTKEAVCEKENTGNANQIRHCRRYKAYASAAANNCVECHRGYHSDWVEGDNTTGKHCIPDDSPCSLPACKQYKKQDKFEYLRCHSCHNQWKYYTKATDTAVSKLNYNVNTYTYVCDNVESHDAEARSPTWSALYSGNDEAVIEINKPDDEDDKPIVDDDDKDREKYTDPVVYGSNLSVSLETVVIALFAAVTIFI